MTGIQNSHIEILLGLCQKMLVDLYDNLLPVRESLFPNISKDALRRDAEKQAERDYATISRRVGCEGLKTLTGLLPKLGKYLDGCLEHGEMITRPEGLAPYGPEGFPQLLATFWMTLQVYLAFPEVWSDRTKEEQFLLAVKSARTLLYAYYKLEVPFTQEQLEAAEEQFKFNDSECEIPWSALTQEVVDTSRRLIAEVLEGFDPYDITPKHGPGAVATGEKLEEKWTFGHKYPSLHRRYPYYTYMYGIKENGIANQLRSQKQRYLEMVVDINPTSKVVFVPKDSRGPRTICAEPLEIQYIQQGILAKLVPHIERHDLTRGHVNFRDQGCNASLALASSLTRDYATLDLKDASDLVSLELFNQLFPDTVIVTRESGYKESVLLKEAFLATRSSHARLPSGEVIELKKFAPMGSALCFPVEALIFWAVCVNAVQRSCKIPFNVAQSRVFVYGDDLIVPTDAVRATIACLESVGLRVNVSKCCYRGKFRESCGVDAYNGFDITPQRIKHLPGLRPSEGAALAAWVAYASQLAMDGMYHSSEYCRQTVQCILGPIPVTDRDNGYLSIVSPAGVWSPSDYHKVRWNARLQLFEAKVWVLSAKKRPTSLDSWERLHRGLVAPVENCDPSEVVVPKATKLKQRWMAVYHN